MIKILFIIDQLGAGGKERRLVELLKGLDESENISSKLIVLTDKIHYRGIFETDTEVINLDRKIRKDPLVFFRIHKICKSWKPDIIHAWGSMPAIYSIPAAKILGITLINASIADAPANLNRSQRIRSLISFQFSDYIQANSHAGIKSYNAPRERSSVIHNGFNFDRVGKLKPSEELKNELGINTEYVVGMVAGFNFHKDYETMVIAAAEILETRDDVTFVFVGEGPGIDKIKDMARRQDRFIFTGKRDDIESIVNIFDIGILLTNLETHGEGISNSIMEYMALGKPVIATDGGGTPELVMDGDTGFLIPHKSTGRLQGRIEELLDSDKKRKQMGHRGKERVQKEFNIDRMIEKHKSLYRHIMETGKSDAG